MKIIDILEAKYYGKHTGPAVVERLNELSKRFRTSNITTGVLVNNAWLWADNKAKADFTVHGVKNHRHVKEKVKQFLESHGIPFTEIFDVVYQANMSGTNRWMATMVYDPNPVTEARYYRNRPTADEVADMYRDVKESGMADRWDRIMLGVPRLYEFDPGVRIVAEVTLKDKQKAMQYVKHFLDSNNLPYTEISREYAYASGWEIDIIYRERVNN